MTRHGDLTAAQREAVQHGEGPLLVVAGPGSGKTRVITRRVASLIDRGVRPGAILAITFTNKAAQEMARRVEALGAPPGAWVKTFHATCASILRRWPEPAGLAPGFSIFDQQDQTRILRAILKRTELSGDVKPAEARQRISRWKTSGLDPDAAEADASSHRAKRMAGVYRAYEQELAESNAVDFDDLLVRTRRALEDDADVRSRLQSRFEHVLIDEYQDTSPVQFHLARLLAEPQNNVCATGDPDQSIYAFRNADVRNILEFEKNYPGAAVVRLEQNFRSVGNVLKAADALISNNRDRHVKRLFTEREDGEPVHVVAAANEHDEGMAIASSVLDRYAASVPYKDMAVFYRVNAQSRAIETALRARGVPYMIVKGVEFYQRAEVKDLIAYLKVLANPRDRESMTRVLTTPRRGIGVKTLARLFDLARERGWNARQALRGAADAGELGKRATLALRDVAGLFDRLERGVTGSVAELVRDVVTSLRYEDHLKRAFAEDHEDRIANVRELIGGAEEYDARAGVGASLPDFLHEVGLVSDADQYDPDMPRVALMTLHSAKGLEFRDVYVTGIEDGLLPHARSAEDAAAVEEERRLLFVGITRAKEHLTLSFARERRARLAASFVGGASPFLAELPQDALDVDVADLQRTMRPDPFADPYGGRWGGSTSFSGGTRARHRGTVRSPFGSSSARGSGLAEGVDHVPDYDGVDPDPGAEIRPGARVRHPHFGEGVVVRVMGLGERLRLVVRFRGRGEKTLAASQARLTLLG